MTRWCQKPTLRGRRITDPAKRAGQAVGKVPSDVREIGDSGHAGAQDDPLRRYRGLFAVDRFGTVQTAFTSRS